MPKYFKTLNQVHNEYDVYPTEKIIERLYCINLIVSRLHYCIGGHE